MTGWQDKKMKTGRNIGVVIGRFQPFHNGHAHILQTAIDNNEMVVVVLGSAGHPKSIKNPFTQHQRVEMISNYLNDIQVAPGTVQFTAVPDYIDDEDWILAIRTNIYRFIKEDDNVTLYGYAKDESSFYLNLFPDWKFEQTGLYGKGEINATNFRDKMFEGELLMEELPLSVQRYLGGWMQHDSYKELKGDYEFIKQYREQFEGLKYDPIFVTVNAMITMPGKVFVMKRKSKPGRGLLSLPGTFLDPKKSLEDTLIDFINKNHFIIEKDWIEKVGVFDKVGRALRGRTISHIFKIKIPRHKWKYLNNKSGEWIDVSNVDIYREQMYGDHAQIIKEMI